MRLNHPQTVPTPQPAVETLSLTKPVPGAKKIGDCCTRGSCLSFRWNTWYCFLGRDLAFSGTPWAEPPYFSANLADSKGLHCPQGSPCSYLAPDAETNKR